MKSGRRVRSVGGITGPSFRGNREKTELDQIMDDVASGSISAEEASRRIKEMHSKK